MKTFIFSSLLLRYGLMAGSLLAGFHFLRTKLEQLVMYRKHYHWMLYGKPYGAVLTILKDLVEDGKVVPIVDTVYRSVRPSECGKF